MVFITGVLIFDNPAPLANLARKRGARSSGVKDHLDVLEAIANLNDFLAKEIIELKGFEVSSLSFFRLALSFFL